MNPAPKRAVQLSASKKYVTKLKKVSNGRWNRIKSDIQRFYRNPAIARVLPPRRYATKGGPGYALLTTLKQAHILYQDKSGHKVAFSLFSRLRPKNVRKLGSVPVETCLCISCTNVKLKIDALNRDVVDGTIPREGHILKFVLCPFKSQWARMECIDLSGDCFRCKDRIRPFTVKAWTIYENDVQWLHWERRPLDGKLKLDVFPYKDKVSDLLAPLNDNLEESTKGTSFVQHLFNAYWQFSQYSASKDSLRPGQVLLVQDFAENKKASYAAEVKSAHFGKQQVTLHPTVCFYKTSEGHLVRHVVMLFSDDIAHDYHAVHAFTSKTIDLLKQCTEVSEVHVIAWSDGAAAQYKRKFFDSEHGKGEADGDTGRFSRAMTRAVASGANFRNAEDMVAFGQSIYKSEEFKKYSFILVEPNDIIRDRHHTNVKTLPGSISLHQFVKRGPYKLQARKHYCFCCGCVAGKA